MFKLIVKLFVKDYKNHKNPDVRERYGLLSSIVGIIVNIILSLSKLVIGSLTSSISITADAINNLSDAGSSVPGHALFFSGAEYPEEAPSESK